MKRKIKSLISLLLSCLMVFTLFIQAAYAKKAETEDKLVIFSIGAGRKYFSEAEIKSIINKAYENGYTSVQLILGNEGLRFFLDNMAVSGYESDQVKDALNLGNKSYYDDPEGSYLTEGEMNRIIDYAARRKIEIIPVINSPGHMAAVIYGMERLGIEHPQYKDKTDTVDLENGEAVAFTKELTEKYVKYFSEKGNTNIFGLGCDEYGGGGGRACWEQLQQTGKYKIFISYVNELAKMVKSSGLKPMCFNDGIYYAENDIMGSFDKDIIVSYWTKGWRTPSYSYNVASAKYLSEKGHKILNTNDGWYWVIGINGFRKEDNGYGYVKALFKTSTMNFNNVRGGRKIPTIGSMQCVWADFPEEKTDYSKIFKLMHFFSKKNRKYMRKI